MTRSEGAAAPLSPEDFADLFDAAEFGHEKRPLLLAVSGGPDSIALMHAAAAWSASRTGPPLAVATVDHGLRAGARREADTVGRQAAALGLPHAILTWDREAGSSRSQAAAREARYRLLAGQAAAVGASLVATAHTRDDQAETVLMRLAAGSGLTGLGGMTNAARLGGARIVRPFLSVAKARLVATCRERGWSFVEDPSNSDPRFARPRWRRLTETLAAEGLSADRLSRFADRMRRADSALDAVAEQAAARLMTGNAGCEGFPLGKLLAEPDEIALRIFIRLLARQRSPSPSRLERIENALATLRRAAGAGRSVRLTLAGQLLILDRNGTMLIEPEPERRRGRRRDAAAAPQSPGKDVGIAHLADHLADHLA